VNVTGRRLGGVCIWMVALASGLVLGQAYPDSVGVGIDAGSEGARSRMFVDLGKVWRPMTRLESNEPAPTDERGWPLSDAKTVLFDIRPIPAWSPPIDDPEQFQPDWSGTYKVSFRGQAELRGFDISQFRVKNQSYDPLTNTTKLDLVVEPGTGLVAISFVNTRRSPEDATGTGFTDLRVIRPGYPEDTGKIFTDEFLTALKPFRVIRFMGFLHSNNTNPVYPEVVEWSERRLPSHATQQRIGKTAGFAWEYAIEICNLSGKDMWINIPVAATEDYIRNLAELLKEKLKPELRLYVEINNEVWNPGFTQYRYNMAAAVAEVEAGGSPLNADIPGIGSGDRNEWHRRRHAKGLVDAIRIFGEVFGPEEINQRIRSVHSWWTIYPAEYRRVLEWVRHVYGDPSNHFYAIAKTQYFNAARAPADATVEQILEAMKANSDNGRRYTQELRRVADDFQLRLFAYEGGPDNGGGSTVNVGNRILANRSEAMADLMKYDLRENWFNLGGELHMYLELVGPYSRFGCWGQTEDIINLNTPRMRAIYELVGMDPPARP